MLRHPLLLVALIALVVSPALAQMPTPPSDTSDPRILVLLPQQVTIDKKLKKEEAKFVAGMKRDLTEAYAEAASIVNSLKANPEMVTKLGISIAEADSMLRSVPDISKADFGWVVADQSASFLRHELAAHHYRNGVEATPVFIPTKLDSASIAAIAAERKAHFVLCFPTVKLWTDKSGKRFGTMRTQLYAADGRRLLDTSVTAGDENQGFTYTCADHRLDCPVINALSVIVPTVVRDIERNTPKTVYARRLAELRSQTLMRDYYGKPVNLRIKNLLPIDSTMPPLSAVYACFANADTSAIVALYAERSSARGLGEGNRYGDRNVTIATNDFRDLDNTSNTYAFFLTGAKVNGRWYFMKQQVTYFDADSLELGRRMFFLELQNYNFFRPMSVEANPEFWSTGLFEKVPDSLHRDPVKDVPALYDPAYARRLTFVGQYRFVAEQMAEEEERNARQ